MRKPNFFIAGAPKSGTTAMNDFLNQHPDIFMAKKEIHFFGKDLNIHQPKLTEDEYLTFFKEGQKNKIIGESSVWYLFSKTAAEEIKTFSPAAKILIMLRNPLEMMPALHKQNIYDANEDIPDFEEAVFSMEDRKKGKKLPKNAEHLSCLFYTDAAKYYLQVKRYIEAFGKMNVYIIIYDDFKENNLKTYKSVLKFLEVNNSFEPQLNIINPAKKVESFAIHQFIKKPANFSRKTVRMLIPYKPLRHFLMEKISGWNMKDSKPQVLNEDFINRLKKELAEDVNKLSELLGRDLRFWVDGNSS